MSATLVNEENGTRLLLTSDESGTESQIGVTTGLLQNLDRQELEGVLAHEMAHIYNRDTLLMMVAAILVGVALGVGGADLDVASGAVRTPGPV